MMYIILVSAPLDVYIFYQYLYHKHRMTINTAEVRNVSQWRQRKEDRAIAIGNMQIKFDEYRMCGFWDMYADRQMHKSTNKHATLLTTWVVSVTLLIRG